MSFKLKAFKISNQPSKPSAPDVPFKNLSVCFYNMVSWLSWYIAWWIFKKQCLLKRLSTFAAQDIGFLDC